MIIVENDQPLDLNESEELQLQKSKRFLKSILVQAFENKSWLNTGLSLDSILLADEELSHEDIIIKLFKTSPEGNDKQYVVGLNMFEEITALTDHPPFYLTIIVNRYDEGFYSEYTNKLCAIQRNSNGAFSYLRASLCDQYTDDLFKSYKKIPYSIRSLINIIKLNTQNIQFLKTLLEKSNQSIELLTDIEEKIKNHYAFELGYPTLQTILENLEEIVEIERDDLKNRPLEKGMGYFLKQHVNFSDNITYRDLEEVYADITGIYVTMSFEEYSNIAIYFKEVQAPDKINLIQKEPSVIVRLQFAIGTLFYEDIRSKLEPKVIEYCENRLKKIVEAGNEFNKISKAKLSSFYKAKFNVDPKDIFIVLQFGMSQGVFIEGLQSHAITYGVTCKSSYFLKDQLNNGLEKKITDLIKFVLPDYLFISTDHLLQDMEFCSISGNYVYRLQEPIDNILGVYKGWEYGLKFMSIDQDLKQMYLARGKDVGENKTNVQLTIPLPNLALYYLLKYAQQIGNEVVQYIQVVQTAIKLILDFKLCLPKKYQDMIFGSHLIAENDKEKILSHYQECYKQQIKSAEKIYEEIRHSAKITDGRVLATSMGQLMRNASGDTNNNNNDNYCSSSDNITTGTISNTR